MKSRFKIVMILSTLCLAIVMCTLGVFALLRVSLNLQGNVNFTADGVKATISQGTLSGGTNTGTATMKAVTINGNNNLTTVESNLATWEGFNLKFNENSQEIVISFKITNTHTTDYLEVSTSVYYDTSSNVVITPSSSNTVLYPANSGTTDEQQFYITIYLIDDNYDVAVNDFVVNLFLQKYEIPDESDFADKLEFSYTSGSGIATVAGVDYNIESAKIPFMFKNGSNTYKVTEISSDGFYGYDVLESIIIPNSVTIIGASAFESCSSLVEIIIPNSVTTISDSAFESCSSLNYAMIPNSVKTIEYEAFYYSGIKFAVIPSTVTTLDTYAYRSCRSLTTVRVNCTTIGENAFDECSALVNLSLGNNVRSIYEAAFSGTAIEILKIPSSVSTIRMDAFYYSSLKLVFFENVEGWWDAGSDISLSVDQVGNSIYMANLLVKGFEIRN